MDINKVILAALMNIDNRRSKGYKTQLSERERCTNPEKDDGVSGEA